MVKKGRNFTFSTLNRTLHTPFPLFRVTKIGFCNRIFLLRTNLIKLIYEHLPRLLIIKVAATVSRNVTAFYL